MKMAPATSRPQPSANLTSSLRKAGKCELPPIAKARKGDVAAIDARAELGLRAVKQLDAVLGLLRTRPIRGGLKGRLDHSRVARPIGTREIAALTESAEPSVALWDRLAGISACAWRDLLTMEDEATRAANVEPQLQAAEEEDFRSLYMEILTDGAAGELDQIREDEQLGRESVQILVNALETGANTYLPFERTLIVHSFTRQ
jgi:hypothetical protein